MTTMSMENKQLSKIKAEETYNDTIIEMGLDKQFLEKADIDQLDAAKIYNLGLLKRIYEFEQNQQRRERKRRQNRH